MTELDRELDRFQATLPGGRPQFSQTELLEITASRASFQKAANINGRGRSLDIGNVALQVKYDDDANEGPVVVELPNESAVASIKEGGVMFTDPNIGVIVDVDRRAELMNRFTQTLQGVINMAA